MQTEEKFITALDLGSSKVVALIARVLYSDEIELIGIGISEARGMKAGAVTNIEQTVQSIKEAIDEAELMAGMQVTEVIINVTGKHVKGDNSPGVVAITNKDRVVSQNDIFRVFRNGK